MLATQTHLIPISEMEPGQAVTIRNAVISNLVARVARELAMDESQLVVRDIEPYTDLGFDYGTASAGTAENWERDFTGTSVGYVSVIASSGGGTMGDQRYVAVFGVRDTRFGYGATGTATAQGGFYKPMNPITLIKIEVGGAIKAIWDITSLSAYPHEAACFCPSAVEIPQNDSYDISFYQSNVASSATAKSIPAFLQLIGVTVEPRGKVLTP